MQIAKVEYTFLRKNASIANTHESGAQLSVLYSVLNSKKKVFAKIEGEVLGRSPGGGPGGEGPGSSEVLGILEACNVLKLWSILPL